jgi:thiol:disulfide interchange protein DsbA
MNTIQVLEEEDKRHTRLLRIWAAARSRRYIINIILACVAVGLEVYYSICGGACSYLKGDLIGIPLQYVGMAFMACAVLLSLFKADRLLLALFSAGVGVEAYLVGFQIWHNTYCPYCLAFAGIVIILFLLNFDRTKKWIAIISMALALILFPLFFEGSLTPSYAQEAPVSVPVFGQGKVSVRIYSDYFCPPCRSMEPEVEPLILHLLKNKKINLTFIDTPFYQYSSLYARYYLYAVNEKREIGYALAVRNALIDGADKNISDPTRIEALLTEKGIKVKPFDPRPVFELYGKALKEDEVKSTPTCVVERDGKKEKATGKFGIIRLLKSLK